MTGQTLSNATVKLGLRRVIAFCIDYVFIALYICGLLFISLGVFNVSLEPGTGLSSKFVGHAIAFATLTVPVWLYFTLQEAGARAATLGKRVTKLTVSTKTGQRPDFRRTGIRNAVKLLPWEMAHAAIWYVPGRSFMDPMPSLNMAFCILANLVAIGYALALFIKSGRTPYEMISGTHVTRLNPRHGIANQV